MLSGKFRQNHNKVFDVKDQSLNIGITIIVSNHSPRQLDGT